MDLALGIVLTDLVLIVTSGGFSVLGQTETGGFFFQNGFGDCAPRLCVTSEITVGNQAARVS